MARLSVPSNPSGQFEKVVEQAQTTQGGVVMQQSILTSQPVTGTPGQAVQVAMRSWYSGDRKLMAVQRYEEAGGSGSAFGTWEEYRYDALGRRILTRVRRQPTPKPDSSNKLCLDTNGSCGSYVERPLWDGAQILGEWRTNEGTPTGITSGQVGYVYLDRLDQPIGLLTGDTTRVVQYTWRGLAERTVFIDGTPGDCSIVTTGCLRVRWPAATQGAVYYTPNLLDSDPGPSSNDRWFGTLLANGQGSTGQVFRRNHRYFDPASGQFTQEDPIGVAGGMNLWGLGGGDPVNFSDPFGLCPPEWLCKLANASAGFGDAITFGLTDKIRDVIHANGTIDKDGGAYLVGEFGGFVASAALGAGTASAIRQGTTLATSGVARGATTKLLSTSAGRAAFGKGGALNSWRVFRIGVSKGKNSRMVFRMAGDAVESAARTKHIDLIDLGRIVDYLKNIPK